MELNLAFGLFGYHVSQSIPGRRFMDIYMYYIE